MIEHCHEEIDIFLNLELKYTGTTVKRYTVVRGQPTSFNNQLSISRICIFILHTDSS